MLTGIAMGSTAIALVFSPLGKRSGAHFNPAVTLTFWRLGKVKNWDAMFYIIAQFIGGIVGVFAVALFVREALSHPTVNYAATLPGPQGMAIAFIAEFAIAFVLMSVVLRCEQHAAHCALHGIVCRHAGRDLHHARSAVFGDEHESGAHIWLRFCRSSLDRALDLFHRACPGHAIGCDALSPGQRRGLLREISSLQSAPLHFQLPLP